MQYTLYRTLRLICVICAGYSFGSAHDFVRIPIQKQTACIYFDGVPSEPSYFAGANQAVMLANLLGHFPEVAVSLVRVEDYVAGQLENCTSAFYLGSYFDNPIPQSFLNDFSSTKKRVAWLGYNIWQLGAERISSLWGLKYKGLSTLDPAVPPSEPGFYKYFEYKAETFTKYGAYGSNQLFQAAFEIGLFERLSKDPAYQVLSYARHSTNHNLSPYIVTGPNHWLVADMPFSYMTEEDRYLIFTDVIFDILGVPPKRAGKHLALVRLEDVSAKCSARELEGMGNLFASKEVPFSVSLIPVFRDPLMALVTDPKDKTILLKNAPNLVKFLNDYKSKKMTLLMHGVTHQYKDQVNPTNGISGPDSEFWDEVRHTPIAEDSAKYVVSRLEWGLKEMNESGLQPLAWVTPHYSSSVLDQLIFGQLFDWSIGRAKYGNYKITQKIILPSNLKLNRSTSSLNGKRLSYFTDLKVSTGTGATVDSVSEGQLFPYEIYRDYFGNAMVPENVGYIEMSSARLKSSVDLMLQKLSRNRVIRDSWGSFFVHPYLFGQRYHTLDLQDYAHRTTEVERLLQGAKDLGYEFVDLKTWMQQTH